MVEFFIWLNRNTSLLFHKIMSVKPFDLVHIDIWGLFHIATPTGHKYFLTIVDDCICATWVYLLRAKSDVLTIFPYFFTLVSTQYNTVVKSVRFDNASKLTFHNFFHS